ncbi:hypothetical protein, unlikely [Trypanosoma congolense IL3000]|uniref:Uncharacterized protein n=1 Tax=Trypanosoma congolense (strain IL3000) TaxID=1068625 RepID=F9WD65_TRYCI|nr:hypothetical protein, unlikely [Trypanosoma congolense IL3000]
MRTPCSSIWVELYHSNCHSRTPTDVCVLSEVPLSPRSSTSNNGATRSRCLSVATSNTQSCNYLLRPIATLRTTPAPIPFTFSFTQILISPHAYIHTHTYIYIYARTRLLTAHSPLH